MWGLCSAAGTKHVNTISVFNTFRNKQRLPSDPHWRLFHLSLTAGENPSLNSSFSSMLPHVGLTDTLIPSSKCLIHRFWISYYTKIK